MADKASRKEANRKLAESLRAAGILPTGGAWQLAREGVTDTARLLAANVADGDTARKRGADMLPAGIRPGDYLPDYSASAVATVLDRDGAVWVVELSDGREVDLGPLEPVRIARKREAPAWVAEAAAAYRDARDAWEAARESGQLPPGSRVAGTAGADVGAYQLTDAEFREAYPPPRYADYLKGAAEERRERGA